MDAPVKVSPLIRAARWGLLGAGIFYGLSKNKILTIAETSYRKYERQQEILEDKRVAKEVRIKAKKEIIELMYQLMPPAPEGENDEEGDVKLKHVANIIEPNIKNPNIEDISKNDQDLHTPQEWVQHKEDTTQNATVKARASDPQEQTEIDGNFEDDSDIILFDETEETSYEETKTEE